jgi:glycosyltransferase involved in cell wall biosynthesis
LRAVHVLGGTAGAHARSLAGGLVARGVEVTVCAPPAALDKHGFHGTGARLASVRGIGGRPGPRTDAAAVAALRFTCADADVVHAQGTRTALLASLALVGMRRRPPLVVTWQGNGSADGLGAGLLQLAERRAARAATVVLGATSELVDRVRRLGARDARLAPYPCLAVWHAEQDHSPVAERVAAGAAHRPLLLAACAPEPHDGCDTLLDAARGWSALQPTPLVVIVGDSNRSAAARRWIEADELPVRIPGPGANVPALLAAADLVVVPGHWESHLLIVQQALRTGVPLVIAAAGGLPELVGEAAEPVPAGDPYALARAAVDLLGDPARRAYLAEAGRAQAATWPTEDDSVAQVLSVYDELTGTV